MTHPKIFISQKNRRYKPAAQPLCATLGDLNMEKFSPGDLDDFRPHSRRGNDFYCRFEKKGIKAFRKNRRQRVKASRLRHRGDR